MGAETVGELLADQPGADELIDRARARGYLLVSEVADLHDPVEDGPDWLDRIGTALEDSGLTLVDDQTDGGSRAIPDVMTASTDPVRHYLNGIGRTDLLTAEEEVDLAKRDRAGRSARQLLNHPGRLNAHQRALLRRIDLDGRRAHDHMVRANLRLVVSVSRRFRGRGLDLLDLVQEGNLGLIRAVQKFDHTRGYKFSTYATWWIRQALTRGIADKSRVLRLPVHVHEMLGKIRWTEIELVQQFGRDPTDDEIAEGMNLTVDRLRELRSAARDLLSLDLPLGEDGDATMGQLVADEGAIDPEDAAAFVLVRDLVQDVLETLDERERGVVMRRFGLIDGESRTLEEVGTEYGVTRERIRQIEAKTLTKLRHPSRADRLKGLISIAATADGSENHAGS